MFPRKVSERKLYNQRLLDVLENLVGLLENEGPPLCLFFNVEQHESAPLLYILSKNERIDEEVWKTS